jgi:hypothetical protein
MRGRWHWLIPAGVTLCFLAPISFTDRTFASDWGNHYWLIYVQGLDISSLGAPSIYLQLSLGAFYPYYAFYGGTFYAVTGFLADLFDTEVAVLLATAGAIAATYLGWTWMAMQAGVRGWRVQLPGLIAATAPLAVSNLYGRGGIPELIGTSMLPLVAAAGISLVREDRLSIRDAAAFVVGLVFLTGSHVLSMVWGVTLLAVLAVVLIACYWPFVKERALRLFRLAWLGLLAACINAWMLGPIILFHSKTVENSPDPLLQQGYTSAGNLFRILRDTPDLPNITGDVNAALPILALLWALACAVVVWRLLAPRTRVLALGLLATLAGIVVLILDSSLIWDLPEFLQYIQFPYRLVTYADFCVVGLVTLVLAGLERRESSAGSFARCGRPCRDRPLQLRDLGPAELRSAVLAGGRPRGSARLTNPAAPLLVRDHPVRRRRGGSGAADAAAAADRAGRRRHPRQLSGRISTWPGGHGPDQHRHRPLPRRRLRGDAGRPQRSRSDGRPPARVAASPARGGRQRREQRRPGRKPLAERPCARLLPSRGACVGRDPWPPWLHGSNCLRLSRKREVP